MPFDYRLQYMDIMRHINWVYTNEFSEKNKKTGFMEKNNIA